MTVPTLRIRADGSGAPTLLLLHGLGATADVWTGLEPVLAARWPGRWVAPDLPGHGGSPGLAGYTFGHLCGSVAPLLTGPGPFAVLGHSLGGVIGLALASGWFGPRIAAVSGLGIKVTWTDEELGKARALAGKPNPVYPTRREAAERHLKVAGLVGLVDPDRVPDDALRQSGDGWTLAFDPRAFAVGAPDMTGLLAASRAAVTLAAGERDPMCGAAQIAALGLDPVILEGLGHNAHVEAPDRLGPLIERLRDAAAGG